MAIQNWSRQGVVIFFLLAELALVNPISASAADSNISVKVTIVGSPSCKVNNNSTIDVYFGDDVVTTLVDGVDYKRVPIVYSLVCKDGPSNAVRMQIQGQGSFFDDQVLRTNKTDFGVKILERGAKFPINSWLNFNYQSKPVLYAIPVKRPGATLTGGQFSAWATLKVEYQ